MWATVANDESVMMGFPWSSSEKVELIMDKERGDLAGDDIFQETFTGNSKINFHASGNYKLMSKVGSSADLLDRATVTGTPLKDISAPQRMAEIIIPEELPVTNHRPSDKDIVIDITGCSSQPTRCTVGCMSNEHFNSLPKSDNPMVDTSEWEAWNILSTQTHTWIWVIRRSRNDHSNTSKFYVTLLGDPKWAGDVSAY